MLGARPGFDGFVVHLANHDVTLSGVSRAPLEKLQAYKRRMGWTFPWASSLGSDFNVDFNVCFTEEQQREGRIEYNYRREAVFAWRASHEGGGEGAEAEFAGYKVLAVLFEGGEPAGPPKDFLTGFMADPNKGEVYGRPVGLAVMEDGSLLVTDDAAGIVWRVAPEDDISRQAATLDGFRSPESALQIPDGRIYVSEVGEFEKPGDGGIALVTPGGERVPYVRGLDDPKGLAWWGGFLYVADVKGVYRIDRFDHPILMASIEDFPAKPTLLNDLAVTPDGTLFVSDTGDLKQGGGAVYRVDQSGTVKQVLGGQDAPLQNPNGLLVQRNDLLVADFASGELHRLDLASRETTSIAEDLGAADGIARTRDGQLYVSNWQSGEIFRVGRDGEPKKLGVAERFGAAADIRLTRDGNYLMVPDMKKGTLSFMPL